MKSSKMSFLFGTILILVGVLLLLETMNMYDFRWDTLSSVILIGIGVFQFGTWITNKEKYGLILPGTIMIIYGFVFLSCSLSTWNLLDQLWPFFIIAPGIGLLLMHFIGKKENSLLMTGFILSILGLVFLAENYLDINYWPIIIIVFGIILIWRGRFKKGKEQDVSENEQSNE